MEIVFEIRSIKPRTEESIDYNALVFIIEFVKKVDLENSNDYWIFFKTLIEGGAQKIIINMKDLDYVDSSGISTLINTAKLVRKKDGDIVLASVSTEIRNIFKVINLQDFIKIFNSEGEAFNFFQYL